MIQELLSLGNKPIRKMSGQKNGAITNYICYIWRKPISNQCTYYIHHVHVQDTLCYEVLLKLVYIYKFSLKSDNVNRCFSLRLAHERNLLNIYSRKNTGKECKKKKNRNILIPLPSFPVFGTMKQNCVKEQKLQGYVNNT